MILVVAALTAAAVGGLLVARLPLFIADEAGMRLLRGSSPHSPRAVEVVLVVCGVLLALGAPLAFSALSAGAELTSAAPAGSHAEAPVGLRDALAAVCLGMGVGAAAGASPLLARIDVRIRRLPDRIVLPLLGLIAVGWTVAALSGGDARSGALLDGRGPGAALGIGAACGVLVLLVSVVGGRGRGLAIGLGDVKLAILLGALTGLAGVGAVLAAFVIAHVSACIDAGWQVLVKRRGLGSRLAYGPHLLLGMWTGPLVYAALR